MTDYYSILGLTKNASDIDIKSAFRKLAKIYHPDKNPNDPNAKYLFENILRAYHTLINPHSRRRYDNSQISVSSSQSSSAKRAGSKNQKDYSFTEEELKRRQYYKNYYNSKKHTVSTPSQKANYSDYKYVLFATPIAVGLLMLIISLFNSTPKVELGLQKKTIQTEEKKIGLTQLKNGDMPYNGFFGNIQTFDSNYNLQINNSSGFDAVIVVFDLEKNTYLQHTYLQSEYSTEFSKLPKTGVYWKCILGKNWNTEKLFFNDEVSGGFDSIIQYQNFRGLPTLFNSEAVDEVNLLYVINPDSKNKQYISNETEFFEK